MPNVDDPGFVDFYAAVGRAVTAWSTVEIALSQLFIAILGTPHVSRGFAAFGAITNFRDRLAVIDAAVREAIPDDPLLRDWDTLNKKLRRLATKRNWIAHAEVLVFDYKGRQLIVAKPPNVKLNLDAWDEPNFRREFRDTRQLETLAKAFRLASSRVFAFCDAIRPTLARHEESMR